MDATKELSPTAMQDVMAALGVAAIPGVHWIQEDDECDCIFQRICEWTNPYIARTLRVRLCCIWAEFHKQFPQYVQEIPAYYDMNRHRYVEEPAPWDSPDMPMPLAIWYRQQAVLSGLSLSEVREQLAGREAERPGPIGEAAARAHRARNKPTQEEVDAALQHRLRAAKWFTEEDSWTYGTS